MANDGDRRRTSRPVPRIGALATLPVFYKLNGKRVVLAGGGEPALWKAEILAAAGALVEVFAETFVPAFHELAEAPSDGQILLVKRRWTADDFIHASLAVGSITEEPEASEFAGAARAAGVPVNVVDRPALCDFQFGAVVNRSPLVVGISTDGAAPVFGQAIRSLIESLLPESFSLWVRAARNLRQEGTRLGETAEKRRRFWQRFTDLAVRHPERGPTDAEVGDLIAGKHDALSELVTIIDFNGSADALTLGAVRSLRLADDIFYDEGIPPSVTDFARREARRHIVLGGRCNSGPVSDAITGAVAGGGRVVRLRLESTGIPGGDADEAITLRARGLSVVIISPGHVGS